MQRKLALLLVIGVLPVLLIGCGAEGGLFVSGTTSAPVFEIRRDPSSHVQLFPSLTVVQMHADNVRLPLSEADSSKNRILWKIVADPKSGDSANVEKVERIEYGKVPAGFVQEMPQPGTLAPALQENEVYEVVGPTSLMRNAVARFKILDGKVVDLPMP